MAIVRNYYTPDCSKQINVFFRVLEPRNLIKSRPFHFHQKSLRGSLLVLLLDSSGLLVCLTWLVDIDPSLHSSLLEILLFVYLCIIFLRYQSLSLGLTPINQWHFQRPPSRWHAGSEDFNISYQLINGQEKSSLGTRLDTQVWLKIGYGENCILGDWGMGKKKIRNHEFCSVNPTLVSGHFWLEKWLGFRLKD